MGAVIILHTYHIEMLFNALIVFTAFSVGHWSLGDWSSIPYPVTFCQWIILVGFV